MPTLTHNAVRTKELIDDLKRDGQDVTRLLSRAGVHPDQLIGENPTLQFDQNAQVWELAAEMTGDDLIGFHRAQNQDMRLGGVLTYVGMAAPTLGNLIHNLARYRRVFSDAIELDDSEVNDTGALSWYFRVPRITKHRQSLEYNAVSLTSAARKLTGRELHLVSVSFEHPRNTNVRAFERFFGCAVAFGASRNQVQFRIEDLALPLHSADEHLHAILQSHCDDILKRKQSARSELVSSVERLIVDRIASGAASQENVARTLGMSKRTLARRLSEEGTSFQKVVEGLREALAREYVTDSNLSLTEIAFLLGYSDASSFSTAFRRWTGMAPRQMRMTD